MQAKSYQIRAEKILQRINQLAGISEDAACITRTFGTPAFLSGCQLVKTWMEEAGLQVKIDNIGNVRGKLSSSNPGAKTFIIASHIDTIINAGKFDGPLGVIMGIDALEQIQKSNVVLPFHIELVAFSDEEGVRFHTTYLGSRVLAGSFDNHMLDIKDASRITMREVVTGMGGDCAMLSQDSLRREDILGYFEIHIEQGPVLYEKHVPVALVSAIAGQERAEVHFKGIAGHAGTVPMEMRKDALAAAAEFILGMEGYAKQTKDLVATVGKIKVPHAASNVIPGEVICSVDIRSAEEEVLKHASAAIIRLCTDICTARAIEFQWKAVQGMKPVQCDQKLSSILKSSIVESGFEEVVLVSGAGHDAVPVSQVAPVSMMFVRCFEGISHNPIEDVEQQDIEAAVMVTDRFLQNMISVY